MIQLTHLEERNPRFRKTCLVFILLAALGSAWAQNEIIQDSETVAGTTYLKSEGKWYASENGNLLEEVFPDTLIVGRDDRRTITNFEMAPYGATVKEQLHPGYAIVTLSPNVDSFSALASMIADGYTAAFDSAITFYSEPNDPYFRPYGAFLGQWALYRVGMPAAWDFTKGSPDIVVAVSDSGVNLGHDDLKDNIWLNTFEVPNNGIDDDYNGRIDDTRGWNFQHNNNNPDASDEDSDSHGTNAAGVIAARTSNRRGGAGVAGGWNTQKGVSIMAIRHRESTSEAMSATLYAVQTGAHVVNMSWGTRSRHVIGCVTSLFDYLGDTYDCVLLAASGNDTIGGVAFPAALPETIAVGSCNSADHYRGHSYGPELDLVAPITLITPDITDEPGIPQPELEVSWASVGGAFTWDYYAGFGGTSAAAPMVSGSAGLMLSLNKGLSPHQIKKILQDTAEKVWPGTGPNQYDYNWNPDTPGHSRHMGYGRLRVDEALRIANQQPSINLLEPQPDTYFVKGDPIVIRWDRRGYTGPVHLKLYNSRGVVQNIASSLTTSEFTWINPGTMVTDRDYRIKIEGSSVMYDYTDRPFGLGGVGLLNAPDPNFLEALFDLGVDTNEDERIDLNEAAQVVTLNLSARGIVDLTGIEWFTSLQTLDCSHNQLTDLSPIHANTAFMARCDKSLDCSYNLLDHLDVCAIACSPWLSFEALPQPTKPFTCLCWDPACGGL